MARKTTRARARGGSAAGPNRLRTSQLKRELPALREIDAMLKLARTHGRVTDSVPMKHVVQAVQEELCRPALARAIVRAVEREVARPVIWVEIDHDKGVGRDAARYRQKIGTKGRWSPWRGYDGKRVGFGFTHDKKWREREHGRWSAWHEPRS